MQPVIDQHIYKDSHLMSDKHRSCMCVGKQFSAHSLVNHSKREYARGEIHNNTAETFSATFKRAQIGVFHYISAKHLSRYLRELEFRWENRVAEKKRTKFGKKNCDETDSVYRYVAYPHNEVFRHPLA